MTLKALLKETIPLRHKAYLNNLLSRHKRTHYSQFGEDAYLQSYFIGKHWSTLKGGLPKNGFYVDIGAYSPTECSNTKVFSDLGWRGINVDATPGVADIFDLLRPRDKNLHLAIGPDNSPLILYCWGIPCVFNTANPAIAKEREASFNTPATQIQVPCCSLAELFEKHAPNSQQVDFLSVDVEGLDYEVLKSNDWDKYRPELVVAESYANTMEEFLETDIYKIMTSKNYTLNAWLQPSVIFKKRNE